MELLACFMLGSSQLKTLPMIELMTTGAVCTAAANFVHLALKFLPVGWRKAEMPHLAGKWSATESNRGPAPHQFGHVMQISQKRFVMFFFGSLLDICLQAHDQIIVILKQFGGQWRVAVLVEQFLNQLHGFFGVFRLDVAVFFVYK